MSTPKLKAVGIDPGGTGAFVGLDASGNVAWWRDMPMLEPGKGRKMRELDDKRAQEIVAYLASVRGVRDWCIEVPHMHGKSTSGQSSINRQYGILYGTVRSLTGGGSAIWRVTPNHWHRRMLDLKKVSKADSMRLAKERWPDLDLRKSAKARKDTRDGRADAAWLALYAFNEATNNE